MTLARDLSLVALLVVGAGTDARAVGGVHAAVTVVVETVTTGVNLPTAGGYLTEAAAPTAGGDTALATGAQTVVGDRTTAVGLIAFGHRAGDAVVGTDEGLPDDAAVGVGTGGPRRTQLLAVAELAVTTHRWVRKMTASQGGTAVVQRAGHGVVASQRNPSDTARAGIRPGVARRAALLAVAQIPVVAATVEVEVQALTRRRLAVVG